VSAGLLSLADVAAGLSFSDWITYLILPVLFLAGLYVAITMDRDRERMRAGQRALADVVREQGEDIQALRTEVDELRHAEPRGNALTTELLKTRSGSDSP